MLIELRGSVALSSRTGRVHPSSGFRLTVGVHSSTTIAKIKYLVNKKADLPVPCLVIRYLGKVLENDLCLAECHIVDGSSLEVCVLPLLEEIPFSHKHPVTETSTKDLERVFGSEVTEYDVLSRLDGKEATSGCEANGPSKSVREEKKTVGCKEQARGSDEWVARTRRGSVGCKINRPRKVRGSDDRVAPLRRGSICYEMNGPRKAVRKLGKAAGCGGSDGLVAPREIGPCSEQGRGSICYEVNGPRKGQNPS
ncbi:hypothetical protein FRX31_035411 [Thalictrum thalictroides]|uniref:Ubiquitin-like domain-containing protein n=1 Tax=Thalictrum thalictroides TaxID=46969 RepID=A0A7J6URC2_THATH|nr:hypothetical protein FRX31_035411 [Thalictrum thalictroides]